MTIGRNALYQSVFKVKAVTTGEASVFIPVSVTISITCGDETLTLAEPSNVAFNILESKVSMAPVIFPITNIWTVSHPNTFIDASSDCKITSYKFCEDVACS